MERGTAYNNNSIQILVTQISACSSTQAEWTSGHVWLASLVDSSTWFGLPAKEPFWPGRLFYVLIKAGEEN